MSKETPHVIVPTSQENFEKDQFQEAFVKIFSSSKISKEMTVFFDNQYYSVVTEYYSGRMYLRHPLNILDKLKAGRIALMITHCRYTEQEAWFWINKMATVLKEYSPILVYVNDSGPNNFTINSGIHISSILGIHFREVKIDGTGIKELLSLIGFVISGTEIPSPLLPQVAKDEPRWTIVKSKKNRKKNQSNKPISV